MENRTIEEFEKIDANKDGVISREEWNTYVKKGQKKLLKSGKKKLCQKKKLNHIKEEDMKVFLYIFIKF